MPAPEKRGPALRRLCLVGAASLALAACGVSETGTQLRAQIVSQGAKAYDEGLANAEFFLCRAASVGSVQRRYGRSRDLAEAWRTLCLGEADAALELIRRPEADGAGP